MEIPVSANAVTGIFTATDKCFEGGLMDLDNVTIKSLQENTT